jgi:hypothetical protein
MARSSSSQRLRKGLYAFPRLLKLLFAFILVNALLIATIPSTRLSVFRNVAIIKSTDVGVYWNANCSLPVDEDEGIDWGFLELGVEKIMAVYVRNEGNTDWLLDITAENWLPVETPDYITFRSEYESSPVEVGEVVPAALALFVAPDIASSGITSFAFDLAFQAIE